jgi:hypothetical protein
LGCGFDNASQLALVEKDMRLALSSAHALDVPMPVVEPTHETYSRALEMELGPKLFAPTPLAIEEAAARRSIDARRAFA